MAMFSTFKFRNYSLDEAEVRVRVWESGTPQPIKVVPSANQPPQRIPGQTEMDLVVGIQDAEVSQVRVDVAVGGATKGCDVSNQASPWFDYGEAVILGGGGQFSGVLLGRTEAPIEYHFDDID